MSHQDDTISEYHIAAYELNINVANDDNSTAIPISTTPTTTPTTTAIATNNTINDYNINDDNADRSDSNDCDKPDYLNIDCDRNLNIRCVGMDFEVNKFYMCALTRSIALFLHLSLSPFLYEYDCSCYFFCAKPIRYYPYCHRRRRLRHQFFFRMRFVSFYSQCKVDGGSGKIFAVKTQ